MCACKIIYSEQPTKETRFLQLNICNTNNSNNNNQCCYEPRFSRSIRTRTELIQFKYRTRTEHHQKYIAFKLI